MVKVYHPDVHHLTLKSSQNAYYANKHITAGDCTNQQVGLIQWWHGIQELLIKQLTKQMPLIDIVKRFIEIDKTAKYVAATFSVILDSSFKDMCTFL